MRQFNDTSQTPESPEPVGIAWCDYCELWSDLDLPGDPCPNQRQPVCVNTLVFRTAVLCSTGFCLEIRTAVPLMSNESPSTALLRHQNARHLD